MATVLLAEDDRDVRHLIVCRLERSGHTVLPAADGLSVLAAARRERVDAALLDVGLPGLSGLEVCRALRDEPTLARIPILLVTARAAEADVVAGLAAGADDYVIKPFSPRRLIARMEALLAEGPARTALQSTAITRTLRNSRHLPGARGPVAVDLRAPGPAVRSGG